MSAVPYSTLATAFCSFCGGSGRKTVQGRPVCLCVYRRVARMCIQRLRMIEATGNIYRSWRLWTRDAEYAADVWFVVRDLLDATELIVYQRFFLLDEPWSFIDEETRLGRGQFFHSVYRIEEKLGRALIDSPMFPPRNYYSGLTAASAWERNHGQSAQRHTLPKNLSFPEFKSPEFKAA